MSTSGAVEERLVGGRYRLRHVVGRGGMGVLWAAEDRVLGREVAVKEIVPRPDLPASQLERALREARAAARVTHPGAVTVYDVVEEDGRPWIVMQLLPPRTLGRELAEHGPVTPAAATRLGLDLVDALAAAHSAGVLHRDVKPGNVLFAGGRAVLVDFGIASLDDDTTIGAAGLLLGSPAFMPPERARGERPTAASDLWSLGATLFTALEGRPPFRRDGHLPTLAAVVTEEAPPAEHAGPLAPLLAALLARDPADRPTARQARSQLLAAAELLAVVPGSAPGTPDAVGAPAHVASEACAVGVVDVPTVEAQPFDAPAPDVGLPDAPLPAPPATRGIARLPEQRSRRHGAFVAAVGAPLAVLAIALGLPLPWDRAATPGAAAAAAGPAGPERPMGAAQTSAGPRSPGGPGTGGAPATARAATGNADGRGPIHELAVTSGRSASTSRSLPTGRDAARERGASGGDRARAEGTGHDNGDGNGDGTGNGNGNGRGSAGKADGDDGRGPGGGPDHSTLNGSGTGGGSGAGGGGGADHGQGGGQGGGSQQ